MISANNSGQTDHNRHHHIFSRQDIHAGDVDRHIEHIGREFRRGFDFLHNHPKSVTVFGSSVAAPDNDNYQKAEALAERIVRELGYAVITGGGPGIMEAANKGAAEAGGVSVGLNISLPHERSLNAFSNHNVKFSYFFSRKAMLTFAAEAFIFFPGGFGTLDELFGVLTLIQTDKIPRVPIFLYDSDFWNEFRSFLKKTMCDGYHTIDEKDMTIFRITDSFDEIIQGIQKAPVSDWWRNIN